MAGLRKIILPQAPSTRLGSPRHFGTSLRSHGRAPIKSSPLIGAITGPRIARRSAPILLQSRFSPAQQARFNSTTPLPSAAASPAANAVPPTPAPVGSTPLDIDLDAAAFLDMPAHIGYLSEMGIDFGWGTSTMIQWLFEHIHVYSGLPWWASIAAIPILFRILIFKPALNAAQQQAQMALMTKDPRHVAATKKYRESWLRQPRDMMAATTAQREMSKVKAEYNIQFWKIGIPMLQIPIGFGMFRLMRAVSALPVPGMEEGGLWWFKDLSVADPYFILPVVSAASMFLMMKTTMKYMPPESVKIMGLMQYVISPIVLVSTIQMASAVTWMLLISTGLQIIQNTLFHNPIVRRWANLPALKTTAEQAAAGKEVNYGSYQAPRGTIDTTATVVPPEPSQNSWANMKDSWKNAKNSATEKMTEDKGSTSRRKANEYEKRRQLEEQEAYYKRMADAAAARKRKGTGTVKDMQREGKL